MLKMIEHSKDSDSRTESVLLNSSLVIITTDTDGLITYFNKRSEELSGYTSEEMVGKHTPAIFHK